MVRERRDVLGSPEALWACCCTFPGSGNFGCSPEATQLVIIYAVLCLLFPLSPLSLSSLTLRSPTFPWMSSAEHVS